MIIIFIVTFRHFYFHLSSVRFLLLEIFRQKREVVQGDADFIDLNQKNEMNEAEEREEETRAIIIVVVVTRFRLVYVCALIPLWLS